MPRALRGILLGTALAGVAIAACARLLPERFAVNAPLRSLLLRQQVGAPAPGERARFRLPEGFRLGLFAEDLGYVRMLRLTPAGDLLASDPRSGRVLLLERDGDGDGRSDATRLLLSGLHWPHGLDLRDGWLYVAETDAIGRIRFDPRTGTTSGAFERIVTGLPGGGNHRTRTIRFGPDGLLYLSIGSSCNVCIEEDPRRAAILRYRPDGSGEEIYATGLRNAVGFDWRPATGELYATDNGRDLLGDDFPPCELNLIVKGGFYGWPHANGDRIPDPDYGPGHEDRIEASIPPVHAFRAHNAPLGITFLRSPSRPADFADAALVALHGSWNRTRKDGYKVVSLHFHPDGRIEERDFLTGFLQPGERVVGRPVDIAEAHDGTLFISDDYAGVVWRVDRGAPGLAEVPVRRSTAPRGAVAADPEAVARGRELYLGSGCPACHEPEVAGTGARPLRELAARYDEASLLRYLAAPNPPMPAVDLPETARRDLVAFLLAGDRRSAEAARPGG